MQVAIGQHLDLNQSTVSRDLKAIQVEWKKTASTDFDAAKARELAKIDKLERTYWDAWERSCEDAQTKTLKAKGAITRQVAGPDGPQFVQESPAETSTQTKAQGGDPRFLQGVQWCIDRRCKLLGIDAPVKIEQSGSVEHVLRWPDGDIARAP